jgi:hypothetical protein
MPDLLNDAIKEAYEYAPQDITYWDTLEIDHSSFLAPIRIVNSCKELNSLQGIYTPVLFNFTLPEISSGVIGELSININGIPIAIRKIIRGLASSRYTATILYRQYIAENANPDAEYSLPFQVVTVSENDIGVEIKAILSGVFTAQFPRRLMTVASLPGTII